ncbi:MAG: hypothetical protein ACOYVD_05675 [Bacillota bacterium]
MTKSCVLYDNKICNRCQECMVCDLDSQKICDNCCSCFNNIDKDYEAIPIAEIILE